MDFFKIFEFSQLKAIDEAITPTLESIWAFRCHEYSKKFYTPLHQVVELDPLFILDALNRELYPPSIVNSELDGLYEILLKIKDPNWRSMSKEETEALVDSVLQKELNRLNKQKAPTQQSIRAAIAEKKPEVPKTKPKSGSMNFGELERNIESES